MVSMECDYCGESFESEDELLGHMGDEHYEELGRIQRRRVDQAGEDGGATWLYVGGVLVVLAVAVGGGFLLLGGGGDDPGDGGSVTDVQPRGLGTVHTHGTMEVVIDGRQLDFSRQRFQLQDDYFHYEAGNGRRWHVHGQDVTLGYALDTLGIRLVNGSLTFEESTYTNVSVSVNGGDVDTSSYILKQSDSVVVRAN